MVLGFIHSPNRLYLLNRINSEGLIVRVESQCGLVLLLLFSVGKGWLGGYASDCLYPILDCRRSGFLLRLVVVQELLMESF